MPMSAKPTGRCHNLWDYRHITQRDLHLWWEKLAIRFPLNKVGLTRKYQKPNLREADSIPGKSSRVFDVYGTQISNIQLSKIHNTWCPIKE